jgi:hypothetical protein
VANFKTWVTTTMAPPGTDEVSFFEPRWADDSRTAPTLLLGAWLEKPRDVPPAPTAIYLAIWDADYQEMCVVPPNFDPNAILPIGPWKMQDPSLSSIGHATSFKIAFP